jgi:protein-L-isoaspartate(D-aspartate) O-methyltransferase
MLGWSWRAHAVTCLLVAISVGAATSCRSGATSGEGRSGVSIDYTAARRHMVARQIESRGVNDPAVLAAMTSVPRHEFVPEELRASAYDDNPLPIGEGQTISQPYIVALMTEALHPSPTDRVLELGTGSGYQAAVLAAIVDSVYTIEYFPGLAGAARQRLEQLGYDNVVVKAGDGWLGWPERAPFDAAIVTFATPSVPDALVAQLKTGGRLCIPLGEAHAIQELMLYIKQADGTLKGHSLCAVRFVPVQGAGREAGRD